MWVTNSRTHSTDGIQGRADLGHFWLCPEVKTTLVYKRCASKLFIVFHIGPLFLKVLLPPSWGGEETEPLVRRHSSLIEHVLYVCPIAWNLWMLIDLIISRAWKTAVLQEKKKKCLFCWLGMVVYTTNHSTYSVSSSQHGLQSETLSQ